VAVAVLAGCHAPAAEPTEESIAPPQVAVAEPAAVDLAAAQADSEIKSDEVVTLFPGLGWRDGAGWQVDLHGWIFEPEPDSWRRAAFVTALEETVGEDAASSDLFASRVRPFLYDNERGKRVSIAVGPRLVRMPPSGADGHFDAITTLDGAVPPGALPAEAIARAGDSREFETTVFLVPERGLTVISDIDDTVKISNVTDKEALLRKTFLEPFEVVPGMAARYREWLEAAPGGHLHFVSASPWQLYPALVQMLREGGFAAATFSLETMRLQDPDLLQVLASTHKAKVAAIAEHIGRFPLRRFALIGDSGEHDPEVYGEIARRFASQVVYIAIRNVTGDAAAAPRYASAFEGVTARWELFEDPARLQGPP
jgi:hypothetical protein